MTVLFENTKASTYGWGSVYDGGETGAYGDKINFNGMEAAMASTKYKYAKIKVTNLATGKAIIVRVVDRGPFGIAPNGKVIRPLVEHPSRKIDLVRAAWTALTNGATPGLVNVKIELLDPSTPVTSNAGSSSPSPATPITTAPTTPTPTPPTGGLTPDTASIIKDALSALTSGFPSATLTGTNCPPPDFTQQARIVYPGCTSKVDKPIFGNAQGSGASAPAVTSLAPSTPSTPASSSPATPATNAKASLPTSSLKPGALIVPKKKYTVTSQFGIRVHPITGKRKPHNGIDITNASITNDPIYAAADGVVTFAGFTNPAGFGALITIQHAGNLVTKYGHVHTWVVKAGDNVKQGQHIGGEGTRGGSTGVHLHFETHVNGTPVNPTTLLKF